MSSLSKAVSQRQLGVTLAFVNCCSPKELCCGLMRGNKSTETYLLSVKFCKMSVIHVSILGSGHMSYVHEVALLLSGYIGAMILCGQRVLLHHPKITLLLKAINALDAG